MRITDKLRQTIRASGQSLNSIAVQSGVPNPVVWRFANEQQGLSLVSADKLATYFGLELQPVQKRRGKRKSRTA